MFACVCVYGFALECEGANEGKRQGGGGGGGPLTTLPYESWRGTRMWRPNAS